MKNIVIVLFLSIVLFASCKKEAEHEIKKIEVNKTLTPNEEFRYELNEYLQAGEFPTITKTPDKYQVSKISYNDPTLGIFYEYIPGLPNGRSETVIIKIIREHEHDPSVADDHEENDDHTSVIITINFSIP